MKRYLCLALAILLSIFSFSACKLDGKDKDPESGGDDVTAETVDPTATILSIGNQKVSYAVYRALYDSYLPYMQSSGYDPLESQSSLESFQDWLVDSLAQDIVILHQAEENGFELTAEQEAELKAQTEEELGELYDTYRQYAEEANKDDPSISMEAFFEDYIAKVSEYYTGKRMTWEEYKAEYEEESRNSYIIEKYRDRVCAEFEPTAEDVSSWYDLKYESDKASYEQNPGKYKTDVDYYERYGVEMQDSYPVVFVPEGYSHMMHIMVTPQGELSEEYALKAERMSEIEAEYGELAFADALEGSSAHAEQLAALILEYNELKAAVSEEYAAYSAAALEKIEQAYKALQTGRPFAEVMAEFTEDKEVVGDGESGGCEAYLTKGQLISLRYESTRDWSSGIKIEFARLSKGSYSGIFEDNGSYHIIYYASDEEPGGVDIEGIREDIREICAANVGSREWDALVTEWLNDPGLFKDEKLIRLPGSDEVTKG